MNFSYLKLTGIALGMLLTACSKEPISADSPTGGTGTVAKELDEDITTAGIVYPPETEPLVYMKVPERAGELCGGYWLALPVTYENNNRKYPLLLNFTGLSQLGSGSLEDLDKQRGPIHSRLKNKTFPRNFNIDGENLSYIVILPQFSDRPSADQIHEVINYMIGKYRIDQSRIYITGHSLGGGLCWDYAAKYATKLAAIAPVCGASQFSVVASKVIANAQLPVWAFHSEKDPRVDPQISIDYVTTINKFSSNNRTLAKVTIWPDPDGSLGHDAWSGAYDMSYREEEGKNIFEWLLSQKRQ